jgi:hypothetical protein
MLEVSLGALTEFNEEEVSGSQCFKVVDDDGQLIFYAVVRPAQFMAFKIEGLCSQIDAGRDRPLLSTPTKEAKTRAAQVARMAYAREAKAAKNTSEDVGGKLDGSSKSLKAVGAASL